MAEQELQPVTPPADLLSIVEELERSVEALAASLDSVRGAVAQVAQRVRELDMEAVPSTDGGPVLTLVDALEAENARSSGWQPSGEQAPPDASVSSEPAEAEVAHEEARHAVEATRTHLSWSNLKVDAGLNFGPKEEPEPQSVIADETAGPESGTAAPAYENGHEAFLLSSGEPTEALPNAEDAAETSDPEETRREEVRLAVERTRDWMQAEATAEAQAEDADHGARREDERLAVERAAAEIRAKDLTPQARSEYAYDETRREEVRLAVERARAQMLAEEAAPAGEPEAQPAEADDEARREEVRRVVETTRGSLSWADIKSDAGTWGQFQPEPGGFSIGPDQAPPLPLEADARAEAPPMAAVPSEVTSDMPDDAEEARREDVRRAVEAARSEMLENDVELEQPSLVPLVARAASAAPRGADFSGPPIIVIEDPLGRVELSHVFATLSRVDRSAQAALLNYTPHSVTIGLSMLSPALDTDELVKAAQAVFGRVCKVKTEGSRTAIEIGAQPVEFSR